MYNWVSKGIIGSRQLLDMVGVTAQSPGHIRIVPEHVSGDVQRVVNVTGSQKRNFVIVKIRYTL